LIFQAWLGGFDGYKNECIKLHILGKKGKACTLTYKNHPPDKIKNSLFGQHFIEKTR
jgi:hypothetical protein